MDKIKIDDEELIKIRKSMWAIYNKSKDINGVTELINMFSEILAYQIAVTKRDLLFLQDIEKKIDTITYKTITEKNDRKDSTG